VGSDAKGGEPCRWSVRVGGDAAAAPSGEGGAVYLRGIAGVNAGAIAQLDGCQSGHTCGCWGREGGAGGERISRGLGQVRGGIAAAAVTLGGCCSACGGDGSRSAVGVSRGCSCGSNCRRGWPGQDADRCRGRGMQSGDNLHGAACRGCGGVFAPGVAVSVVVDDAVGVVGVVGAGGLGPGQPVSGDFIGHWHVSAALDLLLPHIAALWGGLFDRVYQSDSGVFVVALVAGAVGVPSILFGVLEPGYFSIGQHGDVAWGIGRH